MCHYQFKLTPLTAPSGYKHNSPFIQHQHVIKHNQHVIKHSTPKYQKRITPRMGRAAFIKLLLLLLEVCKGPGLPLHFLALLLELHAQRIRSINPNQDNAPQQSTEIRRASLKRSGGGNEQLRGKKQTLELDSYSWQTVQ